MSSATSIKRLEKVRLKREPEAAPDAGFRPWHFFVLASLMAATVAVIMSGQSTPEHLVLVSLTIASAGLAAAGFYRMLAPLAFDDPLLYSEPLSARTRAALEREKTLTLRSIKELEFDRAMGKISEKDFDEMSGRLRARAIALIKQLDEGGPDYRSAIEREINARLARRTGAGASAAAPAPRCAGCGSDNDADAAFCKRCGARLTADAGAAAASGVER
jgi:hypothetical protein